MKTVLILITVLCIINGTIGCSSSHEPGGSPYIGRSFMSPVVATFSVSTIRQTDTFQLQCSIDSTEFDVHGRWVVFCTDTLDCVTPDAELYRWNPDRPISDRDSITKPLERYSLFGDTEYSHDNPNEQLRYAVGYAFPPVVFRRGVPLSSQLTIAYPGKPRPVFAYGDTSKISFRMIFQIDSILIDKDTIWHANNSVYDVLSKIGCEKRWYNVNEYFTDRRLIVERIRWIGTLLYPDARSFNYNIVKNH